MAERYIPEHRRTQFKAKGTFKPEELRRRREEQQVEIRKAKREENLAKRRGIGTGDDRPGASLGAAPDSDDENPPSESQVCRLPFLVSTPRHSLSLPAPWELQAPSGVCPSCTPPFTLATASETELHPASSLPRASLYHSNVAAMHHRTALFLSFLILT